MQPDTATLQNAARGNFIAAMRQVANSVAVVTTDGASGRHGATVSSFCSVSADPPTMLVCLKAQSRIARCVSGNQMFCVNVLSQEMEDVANTFAGRQDTNDNDRFAGLACNSDTPCGPHINGSVSFHCRLETEHHSGSHQVFIGRVEAIHGEISRPLTYLDGQYRPWLV